MGRHRRFRLAAGQVFALYVMGYTVGRFYVESLRSDHANHILGMRLNFWIALIGTLAGLTWFAWVQWGLGLRGKPRSVQLDDSGATRKARPEAKRVA